MLTTKKSSVSKILTSTNYENDSIEISQIDLSTYVGLWKDHFQNLIYYLKKDDMGYSVVLVFDDDSFYEKRVMFRVLNNQFMFKVIDNLSGEFYLLQEEGLLEFWDMYGKIDTFQNVADL
jgi:hypothetical protein